MSPLTSLLAFVLIPVALGVIIYVLLSASSWTRSGRASADYDGGPFLVVSETAMPNPSHLPRELEESDTFAEGGASAKW